MANQNQIFPKTLLKIFLLLISLAFTLYLHAEIYVWTDDNGNKVYGDEPQKSDQAKPVELEPLTILPFPKIADEEVADVPQNTSNPYTSFTITSPVNDATIRDNTGSVLVNLSSEPALLAGHKIQVFLDGSPYQSPQAKISFTLNNIDRGTHTVSASVIDESGKALVQTQAVSFHLHRFSAAK